MSKKQNQDIESLKSEFEQSIQVKDENLSLNDSFYKKLELFLDEKFSERFQELEKKTIDKIDKEKQIVIWNFLQKGAAVFGFLVTVAAVLLHWWEGNFKENINIKIEKIEQKVFYENKINDIKSRTQKFTPQGVKN